jgi:hypothetical protein
MDSAYVEEQGTTEPKRAYKRRLYNILYNMNRRATGMQEMRITKLWPTTDWTAIWKNIHCTPVSGETKAVSYKAINCTLPRNDRLYRIRISPTDKCNNCGMHDTVLHRLIECGGPQIWKRTTQKIALILRTIPTRIPSDWLLRPQCTLWPPMRWRAVMWILASVVLFRTGPNRERTLRDLLNFMWKNKQKLYHIVKGKIIVANYLRALDMT